MVFFKRKQQQAVAEIHLTGNDGYQKSVNSTPRYLSNDDIEGYAVFRLPGGVDFSHSKIVLKGSVITKTDDHPAASMQRGWRSEKLPFLAVALESRARPHFHADDGEVRIPFKFNLRSSTNLSGVVSELPPSVDSLDESRYSASLRKYDGVTQYNITYSITASAYSQRGIAASSTQKLSLLPVSDAQPPLCASDFPGEYFLAATTDRQSKLHLTKPTGPHIEVAGQEPEPAVFSANDDEPHGPVELPFLLKLSPSTGKTLDQESLPEQVHLKAQLVTRTLVTPQGSRNVPTIEQANMEDSYVRTSRAQDQEYTIAIPRWDTYNPSNIDSFAIANFSFLFNMDGERSPVPTFFTTLLSRRYAIDLTLTFPASSKQTVKLSVPLQIVYDGGKYEYASSDKDSVST